MHDVFLDLWRELDSFDPKSDSLRSFLLARTFRVAADHSGSAGSSTAPSPTAWRALTAEEREAFELASFPCSTYRDVAMFLGKPEATVKASIRTGLTRFRELQ